MTSHVLADLHEYALDILEPGRSQEVRAHLRECRSCLLELGAINDTLAGAVELRAPEAAPSPALRSRLLQDVSAIVPYSIYLDDINRILQGSRESLKKELRAMPHPSSWADGPVDRCRLYPCHADSKLEDVIRTLVLMESGSQFPMHEHLGDEFIVILQGTLLNEDGKSYRPGDQLHMAKGTSHGFEVPRGLDLIYFNVVHQGLRIGEQVITPASLTA